MSPVAGSTPWFLDCVEGFSSGEVLLRSRVCVVSFEAWGGLVLVVSLAGCGPCLTVVVDIA